MALLCNVSSGALSFLKNKLCNLNRITKNKYKTIINYKSERINRKI